MTTTVWNFDRRTGIGASVAPALCGLSPWSSPLGEYLWFVGILDDRFQSDQMTLGLVLEEPLRQLAQNRLGEQIARPDTQRHPDIPWMYASPDGVCSSGHGFESKNVGFRHMHEWGEDGSDDIPDYVLLQAQHQAAVFDFDVVHVGALLGGTDFRMYPIARNERLIARMIAMEEEFWQRVQTKTPPEADWADARTPKLVEAMYPPGGGLIHLGQDALDLANRYVDLGPMVKELQDKRDVVKAKLVEMMGTAGEAVLPSGAIIKRTESDRNGYTVGPGKRVDFRIKQPKAVRTS